MLRKLFLRIIPGFFIVCKSLSLFASTNEDLQPAWPAAIEIDIPGIVVQKVETKIRIIAKDSFSSSATDTIDAMVGGKTTRLVFSGQTAETPYTFNQRESLRVSVGEVSATRDVRPVPLWLSILPPLISIAFALIFREVVSALFLGIFSGTFIIWYYKGVGFFAALLNGLVMIIDTYIPDAILDRGHVSIIIFSMMIGAMVHLITRNGGMKGIVNILSRFASTSRSGQTAAWLMGIAIFFDDYANTLVVGNTMQPMTDRLRISREKLAYIVDSTAAPVAAVAFITTWIGAQLSYISDGIRNLNLDENPYQVFIHSLPYAFYPFLTIAFVGALIYLQRDFGPMLKAERKARAGQIPAIKTPGIANHSVETRNPRWYNAAIPVFVVVLGTITGLMITGMEKVVWNNSLPLSYNLSHIIGQADTYRALLWSSLAATLVALMLTLSQKLLNLKESIDSLIDGFRTMLTAIVILVMAWAIALITQHLHTADFISQLLLRFEVNPYLIPAITFLFASGVSFSTGSSWGTMAIMYPLILPATWFICQANGLDYNASMSVFHNVVSCVLAGSVLGDHVSPISDTTILSSLASSCNHIDHVRTQMPYALLVGSIAVLAGTIPAAFGISVFVLYPAALAILIATILILGKSTKTVSST